MVALAHEQAIRPCPSSTDAHQAKAVLLRIASSAALFWSSPQSRPSCLRPAFISGRLNFLTTFCQARGALWLPCKNGKQGPRDADCSRVRNMLRGVVCRMLFQTYARLTTSGRAGVGSYRWLLFQPTTLGYPAASPAKGPSSSHLLPRPSKKVRLSSTAQDSRWFRASRIGGSGS